jgi:hypothetical protein
MECRDFYSLRRLGFSQYVKGKDLPAAEKSRSLAFALREEKQQRHPKLVHIEHCWASRKHVWASNIVLGWIW